MHRKDREKNTGRSLRHLFFRVFFSLFGMFLTAPGKGLFYLSAKIQNRKILEKVENGCGVLLAFAFYNLSGLFLYRILFRLVFSVFFAFLVVEIFDYIVYSPENVRKALQYYTKPFAKRYDECFRQIRSVFVVPTKRGKRKQWENQTAQSDTWQERKQADEQRKEQETQKQRKSGPHEEKPPVKKQLTPLEEAKAIFQVEEPYKLEEIRSKRNLLLKTYHPDNYNGSDLMCKKVNECYERLVQHLSSMSAKE